ncbi:DUF2301 domain-containing membrane protein [Leptolyngbya boryana CZ1]|jgi:uncharacterized integral membrane protein|uniref:DUF2301 domain-containing membrane protein n=2 Tax=Leptolyngbya boryana TaxID=1184 RepID=A0AA96X010_LEPBY|nr:MULTISPECIES: DUF2301 domain-containing membrane protein [Leptolyngbya]BAY57806.1 putative integral membrane protein [Leptolyngbya boryana NIES-2135]MBD2367251.1 DUF2301 domain-containing membrane protein [Leptolyngbya sp. FACHB-161]MBD2373776.1 DUF2301 domain-containing membrane protein [Leptolyngbya sp. FACHB-238]MBD2398425.1 DUF2301 domain-containing membrane protein [Leptolyngbya sp. FACHB-239]MBD2404078.1 DUF2301 domain-containing membrane protein [Leptolyngbya sp. FACHB-402]
MQTQEPIVYQGQFGEFSIDDHDRQGVILYRSGLAIAALSFAIAVGLAFSQNFAWITPLYFVFWTALGVSLFTIHIYLKPLHLALQAFWAIGGLASIGMLLLSSEPLALYVYQHPITIFGIGFTFAALTGIFFKEAFCFNRFETKFLTPIVPSLLLGHLSGILPLVWEQVLLGGWAVLFAIFAIRKLIQPIPPDIGDKSVFEYLKHKQA